MPDKDEKARRKQMLHAVRDDARQKVRESLPVAVPVLKALFNMLIHNSIQRSVTTLFGMHETSSAAANCPRRQLLAGSKTMAVIVTVRRS